VTSKFVSVINFRIKLVVNRCIKILHLLFSSIKLPLIFSDAGDYDVVMELGKILMDTGITLGRGLAVIVDAILKVSMLKPAEENCVLQQPRPRVNIDDFLTLVVKNCKFHISC